MLTTTTTVKSHKNPVSKNGRKIIKDNSPFKLDPAFIASFIGKKPKFGYNGLGEFVFYRTYSRLKEDGTKETFVDTLQRVVEGCYEIQRVWCSEEKNKNGVAFGGMALPWTRSKAQKSAQEMFQRMWDFKFLPPGRGLWVMGTSHMWSVGSASLNNCGYCSTKDILEDPAWPFAFVMDMSMLGVGVGFDTRGANKVTVVKPADIETVFVIEDSREAWVDSLRVLIESFTTNPELGTVKFDYSLIRPAGAPIKGFGGKASGPDTLRDLHKMMRGQFHNILRRKSQIITSVDIVDFMNFIGRCVVAGNVRRSSEIALGDPADWDYMQMKDKTLFSEQLNSHRWASNNSIFATVGMDYRRVATQIADNGEPGCLWLDNVQNYGRTVDGRQKGIDKRALGTNPCFSGDMRLLTDSGYSSLYDLWLSSGSKEYDGLGDNPLNKYGAMRVINKNGVTDATNVYRTGIGVDLYRVRFSDGSHINATHTHEFITLTRQHVHKKVRYDEQRVMLRDLKVGDLVPLNQTIHFGTYHNPAYAELAGWVIGDGSLSPKKDGQIRAQCTCYENDIETALPKLRGLMLELYAAHNMSSNQSPIYAGWRREQEYFNHEEETIGSNVLGRMLRADGINSGSKHAIPCSIWNGSRETVAAFLRAFASTDGFVHITDNGTIGVRIWQVSRELLLDCRLLLSQFGIASSIKFRKKAGKAWMNDGKGGKKLYNRKAGWELIISGRKQVAAFLNQIGFIQPEKIINARKWLSEHHGSNNSNTGRYTHIDAIEYIGKGDTYCLTEPGNHQIVVEGCQVAQCAEQSLEDAELCCLCETFPAHHEDAADYHRTLKFAYLYAKTVTLLPTHCKKTNAVLLRNRRIGLSQSGIIQAFAKFGRRQVLSDFCNKGYEVVRQWDEIYSEWLCVSKSLKRTSVKPSGCRPWYSLVTTDQGVLTIEDLFENHQDDQAWSRIDGFNAIQDENTNRISKTYNNGYAEVFRITLNNNIVLDSTSEHQWFVKAKHLQSSRTDSNTKVKSKYKTVEAWKTTSEIIPGDIIDMKIGVYSKNTHGLLKPINYTALNMRGTQRILEHTPLQMNEDLAWLLGYLWGDGAMSPKCYRIRFTDAYLPILEKAKCIIKEQFGLDCNIHPASQRRNCYVLEIGSKYIWHWLIKNGIFKYHADNIDVVPKCVRQSSKSDIIAFIAGLCDADGCISKRVAASKMFTLAVADNMFAQHVQDLALSVGLHFSRSLNSKGKNYQKSKHIWLMTLMSGSNKDDFAIFENHLVKSRLQSNDLRAIPWVHEIPNTSRVLGKVRSIESIGIMQTFDVEVENEHWYYAGAVKSHNSVSLLAGATAGIHFTIAPTRSYWRNVRVSSDSALLKAVIDAGYHVEKCITDDKTSIVRFGVSEPEIPSVSEVSIWQQTKNAVDYQRYWADNQVSCTIQFKAEEAKDIPYVLESFDDELKSISFLPIEDHGYPQAPYQPATPEEVASYNVKLKPLNFDKYFIEDAIGTKFCDGDTCQI